MAYLTNPLNKKVKQPIEQVKPVIEKTKIFKTYSASGGKVNGSLTSTTTIDKNFYPTGILITGYVQQYIQPLTSITGSGTAYINNDYILSVGVSLGSSDYCFTQPLNQYISLNESKIPANSKLTITVYSSRNGVESSFTVILYGYYYSDNS